MKLANKKEEFPVAKHYAILEYDTYATDSGYPEDGYSHVPYIRYYWTSDKLEWEAEINRRTVDKNTWAKPFSAVVVNPAAIKVVTNVEIA